MRGGGRWQPSGAGAGAVNQALATRLWQPYRVAHEWCSKWEACLCCPDTPVGRLPAAGWAWLVQGSAPGSAAARPCCVCLVTTFQGIDMRRGRRSRASFGRAGENSRATRPGDRPRHRRFAPVLHSTLHALSACSASKPRCRRFVPAPAHRPQHLEGRGSAHRAHPGAGCQGHQALQGCLRQGPPHQGHGERRAPRACGALQLCLLSLCAWPQRVYAEAKTIMFDAESRRKLQAGINKVADAVGVTLGPRGESFAGALQRRDSRAGSAAVPHSDPPGCGPSGFDAARRQERGAGAEVWRAPGHQRRCVHCSRHRAEGPHRERRRSAHQGGGPRAPGPGPSGPPSRSRRNTAASVVREALWWLGLGSCCRRGGRQTLALC
jgi:hypothetical protein